ncbi:uncharacterized protein LTR77_008559 [Saxophila tyrrhenica]|uniref:Trafficking protein particle complex subunit 6B n=1 Tax=Saxophila tyrrhenica TaxID=1690608 RepID=A0AAV9P1U5_9PEZI|nr:hypothetical protein LTR77_008559 [Saxophila tyrrhenica]
MSKTGPQQPIDTDDIQNPKFAASTLDFLLIELVPLVQRVTEQAEARAQALRDEYRRSQILSQPSDSASASDDGAKKATESDSKDAEKNGKVVARGEERPLTSLGIPATTPTTQEAMFARLDMLGYRVGQGLAERFSANTPRPQTPLDVIKFLCKDLWLVLFRKQIDNLKTNHRGIFVLTDNRFHPLSRMSIDRRAGPKAKEDGLARAQLYLFFPGGVIRGALSALGIDATVSAESTELPSATFQIKTKGAKA